MIDPTGIIDPPGAFAGPDEWRAFVKELEALPESPEVMAALADARDKLKLSEENAEPEQDGDDDYSDLEE